MTTIAADQLAELFKEVEGEKRFEEPLHRHTSFRVGGKADVLFFPKNEESLTSAVKIAIEKDVSVTVIGKGSNLLVRDGGIHGLVISMKRMEGEIELKELPQSKCLITSYTGISLPKLALYTVNRGLQGIEKLIGVPGTLGGALKMNAGAEGMEIGEVVHSVRIINIKGEIKRIPKNEINFYYRGADFSDEGILLEAEIELKKGNKNDLLKKTKEIMGKRNASQPTTQWGAGSIFKNPPGQYAGMLIESAGCKGIVSGDAEISSKHANFIINRGKARAKDIEDLIKQIQEKVFAQTGISLEPEINIIGEP